MKVAVFTSKNESELTSKAKKTLVEKLENSDIKITDCNPDVVISIGGDGTLLKSIQYYQNSNACFVGIRTGTLGFFSDVLPDEIDDFIEMLSTTNDIKVVEYPLLEIKTYYKNEEIIQYGVNELRLSSVIESLKVDIFLDEEYFQQYRGIGLCISTPSGSSGLNKSLGGAIIHPDLNVLQIAEIAPINSKSYKTLGTSIVLPEKTKITLIPKTKYITLLQDNVELQTKDIQKIECRIATDKIKMLDYKNKSYYDRVKKAFL